MRAGAVREQRAAVPVGGGPGISGGLGSGHHVRWRCVEEVRGRTTSPVTDDRMSSPWMVTHSELSAE